MNSEIFNIWNTQKQALNELPVFREQKDGTKKPRILFHEGEIWWCSIGVNIGREIFGKGENFARPVLVVKKVASDLCVIIPMTSQEKNGTWFYEFDLLGVRNFLIFPQIRLVSTSRFLSKIAILPEPEFKTIKQAAGKYLGFI